jgi:Transposase DDE domain group 1
MAAGSAAANAATPLRHAPSGKVRRDRLPASGPPLASPPTLARCEQRVSRTALSRLARGFVEPCSAAYARPPTRIVLDCDDTEAPAHGAQEPRRDAGSEGGYGGLPLHGYAGRAGRLLTTLCKAKRVRAAQRRGVVPRRRTCRRQAGPDTLLLLRGDSQGASPEVRQWRAAPAHLPSVTGLTRPRGLPTLAHEVVAQATRADARESGTGTRCHATR